MKRLRTRRRRGCLRSRGSVPYRHLAQSNGGAPKATDVGVSAKEIHIAVLADVDNPFVPGLFQGIVDGVRAGAKYLNSKAGGGGLASQRSSPTDSKLNPNEAAKRRHRRVPERFPALRRHLRTLLDQRRRRDELR